MGQKTWQAVFVVILAAAIDPKIILPEAAAIRWTKVHEDLTEYAVLFEQSGISSDIYCTGFAASRLAKLTSDATRVAAQVSGGSCLLWSCIRGPSGCQKCRNFGNTSLPSVWIVADSNSAGPIERPTCWQTFMHRVDDSVDFYRNWSEYQSEFGQGDDLNYWMGLNRLHQLTTAGPQPPRVRWEFSLWNNTWYWVENDWFLVLDESQKYQAFFGARDATVSNVLQCPVNISWYMNGSQFSTYDSDNDAYPTSCAVAFHGAWWCKGCHCFNPTGRYTRPPLAYNMSTTGTWATGITYFTISYAAYPFNHAYSMMTFEALISSKFG